ncbi:MAG: GNAT family N-acetyltransferase [bacterium]
MNIIKIRNAKKSDTLAILRLMTELAEFEKLLPPDSKAKRRLIRDAFSKKPPFRILLAEVNKSIYGYAIYFFTYSSFLSRKTLYLEDIFISENYRNQGLGKLFFEKLRFIAKRNKCGRMEWVVLEWNIEAIKFYEKLGASQLSEWKTYRMNFINT